MGLAMIDSVDGLTLTLTFTVRRVIVRMPRTLTYKSPGGCGALG